jgi:hypothetical protein
MPRERWGAGWVVEIVSAVPGLLQRHHADDAGQNPDRRRAIIDLAFTT